MNQQEVSSIYNVKMLICVMILCGEGNSQLQYTISKIALSTHKTGYFNILVTQRMAIALGQEIQLGHTPVQQIVWWGL